MKKLILTLLAILLITNVVCAQQKVIIEERSIILPTYQVEEPDKNPHFYTGRVYQGAQGHVYPYPMYDVLTDNRIDQEYQAVYLENEYIQICVVPELGGRILSAIDKTNDYDFFYHQHVVKPALIGMIGAWMSGGVEWNIPDHHRASSHLPVDYKLEENPDGSKTVWVGETELSRGMRWMVGLTLYPGKSYLEANVKIMNPTPLSHSFLYWANVSVHCDENYQVIFPPNTQYGAQHAKGQFTAWPIGDGNYGGDDRTGLDLSWWKNHHNPTSIFAWNFDDDFLAGYDYAKQAGTVHVANRHVVTGKKFFLWGNNDESEVWERMLTETDGQYLELMVGAYSDNQPDYSWIGPGETREFKQYWFPIQDMEGVKQANTFGALNLNRFSTDSVFISVNSTSALNNARIIVTANGKELIKKTMNLSPAREYAEKFNIRKEFEDADLELQLLNEKGELLIAYHPQEKVKEEKPKPIEKPRKPEDYTSNEELYLTGLRIEQFKNGVVDPLPYYFEVLKRDTLDYRVNTVLGIRAIKEGRFTDAEKYLGKAIKRSTANYTHPKDGEAFYYMGLAKQKIGERKDAIDNYWKATWYPGFQSPAYLKLAEMACEENEYDHANELINHSLQQNRDNVNALVVKAFVLRMLGESQEAKTFLHSISEVDPVNTWVIAESIFLSDNKSEKIFAEQLIMRIGSNVQQALELANLYGKMGAYHEAIQMIDLYEKRGVDKPHFPLLEYTKAYYLYKSGMESEAIESLGKASQYPADYCFPWRLEELDILQFAVNQNRTDSKALYYLGNLLYYMNQKDKAIEAWEKSIALNDKFGYAWRNLGFAYDKYSNNLNLSLAAYEKAFKSEPDDAKILYEYDVIQSRLGVAHSRRLALLEKNRLIVDKRDDAVTQLIKLYNLTNNYPKSLEILEERHFHVWEGSRDYYNLFVETCLLYGVELIKKEKYIKALEIFTKANTYPSNLEVGRSNSKTATLISDFYIGFAYSKIGNTNMAEVFFRKVAECDDHYLKPEMKTYTMLAKKMLGDKEDFVLELTLVKESVIKRLTEVEGKDFFEKFGNKKTREEQIALNYYLLGLIDLAETNISGAIFNFKKSLEYDSNLTWSQILLDFNFF